MKLDNIDKDIEAVVTSYNQGIMILEAVYSLCIQTIKPSRIIIVDDGSTDENSINILHTISTDAKITVPVTVLQQNNRGVSAARNMGISKTQTSMVLVLDGDDKLEPTYIEQVSEKLRTNSSMVAASSYMQTFGVLDAIVKPTGGDIVPFLARNCCPATHILRREVWEKCGGYDETMRSGFEDWDFFLNMLETRQDTSIGIVETPLINYRTTPISSNIKSMTKRLELMQVIIEKHINIYHKYMVETILGIEATSMARLYGWENEIIYSKSREQQISKESEKFMDSPSYGDGGMAAAVRIISEYSEGGIRI